jgi:hypothetical protein
MKISDLFISKIEELELLPKDPKIFWYVSAGADFRGPVFLTDCWIQHELKHHKKKFVKPDLFLYNCLGPEVRELKEKLINGRVELFNDGRTNIFGINYRTLDLNRNIIHYYINPNYIESGAVVQDHEFMLRRGNEAFYFELKISWDDNIEYQKIFYIEIENINFFTEVILRGPFEVVYLCATKEGCGIGGCKKSIIEYIYKDSAPLFFSDRGFRPKYNIIFNDFTKDVFDQVIKNSKVISVRKKYGEYILESNRFSPDSTIYKVEYL